MNSASEPLLRRARPADAAAVAALHIASWRAAYRDELPAAFLASLSVEERAPGWRERLASPATTVLLLERGGELLGFAASGPTLDADASGAAVWELYNLHVAPGLRSGGIGTRLFEETLALGRGAGRTAVSLWVVATNAPARRFYEKHGMEPDGATRIHELGPGARLHEVRYRRSLKARAP